MKRSGGTGKWEQGWGGAEENRKRKRDGSGDTYRGTEWNGVYRRDGEREMDGGKGKREATEVEAESEVIVLEGGSEDGVREETLDVE
jgi:hypothetical protein